MNKENSRIFIMALLATIVYVFCISCIIIDSLFTNQNSYALSTFVSTKQYDGQCNYYDVESNDKKLRIGIPEQLDSYSKHGNVYATIISNYDSKNKGLDDSLNHKYVLEFSINDDAKRKVMNAYKAIWRVGDFFNFRLIGSIVTRRVYSKDRSYLYHMCKATESRACPPLTEGYNYYTYPKNYLLKHAVEIATTISNGREFSGPTNLKTRGAFVRAFIVATTNNPQLSITVARLNDKSLGYDALSPTTIMYRLNLMDNINKILDQCNKENLK